LLHILADENIPFAEEAFGALGEVRLMPGRAIKAEAAREADVLLVRSVTPVGPALLDDADVQFVGSATAGRDHVDVGFLRERGISFAHAPGSNATSVVEYVLAALLRLAVRRGEPLRGKTVGVVGVGAVGGRLARRLPSFGARVLRNDPPRVEREGEEGFASLRAVLHESDVVTLHTPLTVEGAHPTHHLIGPSELNQMKDSAWLVNAARGAVVSGDALRAALRTGKIAAAVVDAWENEPTPDLELLRRVSLATPHVAGYSFDGKVAGTVMLHRALCEHLGAEPSWDHEAVLAPDVPLDLAPSDPALPEADALNWLARQMYDVGADDERLRGLTERPESVHGVYFSELRKTYPRRRAFGRYRLPRWGLPDGEAATTAVEEGLGVAVA
jgi:erythronate-4-phosphate dehydrogenase